MIEQASYCTKVTILDKQCFHTGICNLTLSSPLFTLSCLLRPTLVCTLCSYQMINISSTAIQKQRKSQASQCLHRHVHLHKYRVFSSRNEFHKTLVMYAMLAMYVQSTLHKATLPCLSVIPPMLQSVNQHNIITNIWSYYN